MSEEVALEVVEAAEGEVKEIPVVEQQTLGWKTELPESIRSHEVFAPYKTKNELWNGHIEAVNKAKDLESKLAKSIPKLADNATPEEKEAFFKALGRPDKPEDYKLEKPKEWPTDMPYDAELEKWYRTTAHKHGITNSAAQGLFEEYNNLLFGTIQKQISTNQENTEKAKTEIKKEWGSKYDENTAIAAKVAAKLVSDNGQKDWLIAQDDPMLLRLLLAAAPAFLNDNAAPGTFTVRPQDKAGISYPDMPKT